MNLLVSTVQEHIERLSGFTSTPGSGTTRLIFSEEEEAAKKYIRTQLEQLNMPVREDEFGNLFAVWQGGNLEAKEIWTGSHLDAPPSGGAFDGVAGIISSIEAVRMLKSSGFQPDRTIVIVIFAGEEPSRFGIGCLGSRLLTGTLSEQLMKGLRQEDGKSLYDVLQERGKSPQIAVSQQLNPDNVDRFVELHIEQGPVLEQHGETIGIVNRIAAPAEMQVTFVGKQRHAGATPMLLRADPMPAAAAFILEIERLFFEAEGPAYAVGTVGKMLVHPNASNVIPGRTTVTVDIRNSLNDEKNQWIHIIQESAKRIAMERNLQVSCTLMGNDTSVSMDEDGMMLLQQIVENEGLLYRFMPSGAYHDALHMASIVKTNMLFVPSKDGISHAPEEWTDYETLAKGITVLAKFLKNLSKE